jgi:hypothetical protein
MNWAPSFSMALFPFLRLEPDYVLGPCFLILAHKVCIYLEELNSSRSWYSTALRGGLHCAEGSEVAEGLRLRKALEARRFLVAEGSGVAEMAFLLRRVRYLRSCCGLFSSLFSHFCIGADGDR